MAVTRADIRGRARVHADQDASDFPTDAQYNTQVEAEKRAVWRALIQAGWPVNYTTESITADGTGSYALASGAAVFSVQAVYRLDSSLRSFVPRVNQAQKASKLSQENTQYPSYEILTDPSSGTVLRLYPAGSTGSFEVEYIAEPATWTADADTWYGPVGSDELVALRLGAWACRKEGRVADARELLSLYQMELESVLTSASWVDQRNVPMIRDELNLSNSRRDLSDYDIARDPWGY